MKEDDKKFCQMVPHVHISYLFILVADNDTELIVQQSDVRNISMIYVIRKGKIQLV